MTPSAIQLSRSRRRPEHVSGWRSRSLVGLRLAWLLAVLLLLAGCAPTIDEDARLAGNRHCRAPAPEPNPVPRFTETGFVAADGQVLPLRKWLPAVGRAKSRR